MFRLPAHKLPRRVVAAVAVVAIATAIAGCGGAGGHRRSDTQQQTPPSNSAVSAAAPLARSATVSFQQLSGMPFGVTITANGRYAFVDLMQGRVLVYSLAGVKPRLLRTIKVRGEALGSSLTRDGRLLLVSSGGLGASVISVSRAERGAAKPVLGTLGAVGGSGWIASGAAFGAIETASSANGKYVFVSLEYGLPQGQIAVYRIGSTTSPRFGKGSYVGAIRLGVAVVGSALSPNGRYLYVTSEETRGSNGSPSSHGTLSVIDVAKAERSPSHSVIATVPAMNQPVRVAVSPDGSTVWVTARGSNRLLAFSAAKLLRQPTKALLATVKVGTAPVGVAIFDHGQRLLVANSNRHDVPGAHASLSVVSAAAALAHKPAILSTLTAGKFPREIAVYPNQSALLVTNFGSDQLESVRFGSR